MAKILLVSDAHLFNRADSLSAQQLRLQFFPWLLRWRRVPLWFVRWIVSKLRRTSVRALGKLSEKVEPLRFKYLITLGDQVHGVAERGIGPIPGMTVMWEFLERASTLADRPLFHVPSEHPLGYWDGEDYFPHLKWWPFQFITWLVCLIFGCPRLFPRLTWNGLLPRGGLILRREIGGRLDPSAISNWQRHVGPLWGSVVVEGWTFVWLDCDLIRWWDKFHQLGDSFFLELMEQQDAFLQKTLSEAPLGRVVLFTHRVNVMSELIQYWPTIHAVVFGDAHFASQARRDVAALGSVPFQTWFVPAVWGTQFGIGHPGYATLSVTPETVTFQSFNI